MTTKLYLLDTNILLFLCRGQALGQRIQADFLQKTPERPLVSIVSHGELRVFARRNSWGQAKQEVLQRLLLQCVTLDINHPRVLDAYVEVDIFSQRHPSGARNMGKNDLWIAASALAAGATLLTADRDFEHLSPSLLQAEFVPLSPS